MYTRNYNPLPPPPYDYKPAIQIMLSREDCSSEILFAVLDSGGQKCLFSYSIGEALGIDILAGEEVHLATMSGSIKGYLHDVEMEVLTYEEEGEKQWSFSTRVAFAERDIPRNILGRDGFFEYAKIGFVEMEQKIYLSPYC